MATKVFIGIKRIWYADAITAVTTPATGLTGAEVATLLAAATTKEVKNSHQDTWGYEESDPTIKDYINQLTGSTYFRDMEQQGIPSIKFTMGEYAYEDKEALQGGKATEKSWERPSTPEIISKCIIAQTKTDRFIVFPNASIVGKGNFVEKNIGLGVTATAMETGVVGLASEKWFDGSEVTVPQG